MVALKSKCKEGNLTKQNNLLVMNSKSQFDALTSTNLITKSKSSNDLLSETFSAGSVDICQVVRSEYPPILPMRMEMLSDGFETVRMKRNTLSRCIDKIEATKRGLAEQKIHTAFQYGSYLEAFEHEKARQIRRTALRNLDEPTVSPASSDFHSCSKSSSFDLKHETFSAESVDICQVIMSNQPPILPLRMEVRSNGFETVRSKRTTSKTCIEKCHQDQVKKMEEGKKSGVSYSTYVETHNSIVAARKAKVEKSIISGLGTIIEDTELLSPNQEKITIENGRSEEEILNTGISSTDSTEAILQSSIDCWLEMHMKNSKGNSMSQYPNTKQRSLNQSNDVNLSNPESSDENKFLSLPQVEKEVGDPTFKNSTSLRDRYTISSKTHRFGESIKNIHDKYDVFKAYQRNSTLVEDKFLMADDLTIHSSYEDLSFDEVEDLDGNRTRTYSKSELGSTIFTTSDHMTTTNQIVITFSSESIHNLPLSEDSPEPINSMYSPEDDDLISIASDDESRNDKIDKYTIAASDDESRNDKIDKYIITENDQLYEEDKYAIAKFGLIDEVNSTDNEEDVDCSFILLGEHNFNSKQYHNINQNVSFKPVRHEPIQYHYVDEKYMFSNNSEYQDENDNTMIESPYTNTVTSSFNNSYWKLPENYEAVDDTKKKRKKKIKKKMMKARTGLGLDEIVIIV